MPNKKPVPKERDIEIGTTSSGAVPASKKVTDNGDYQEIVIEAVTPEKGDTAVKVMKKAAGGRLGYRAARQPT